MMLALEMFRSLPRHAAGRVVGGRMPMLLSGFAAPLRLVTIDEPRVRQPGWARLRTRLSGICGSDLGALSGRTSLYFSAVVSMPFVPGHEVVAELVDDCEDLPAGTRVVVDPVLTCAARGRRPLRGVRRGCHQPVRPDHRRPPRARPADRLLQDTGGGWGQRLTAHRSQLHVVPEGYSDEQAILIEPVACAVHTALAARVADNDRVLVSGAGAVGLFTTLALRSLTPAGEIIVVAKHDHQRELALELGATEVVAPGEVLRRVRRTTGAFQVKPEFGSPYLLGGVDVAVDAVGRQAVAGDRAARHPGRRPRRTLRDAGRRRPLRGVVPRARGRRLLRLGAARAGAPMTGPPSTSRPSWSPATPSAGSRRPWPAIRCTAGERRSTTRTRPAGSAR